MIFIGVGSSIGDAQHIFKEAQSFLMEQGVVIKKASSLFKNPPQGGVAKNEFTNAVWQVSFPETRWEKINWRLLPQNRRLKLKAKKLLKILQKAEDNAKRQRAVKWADRTLDLDVLMFHNLECNTRTLKVPHPYTPDRNFVLQPWQEIVDKNFQIPKFGSIEVLIKSLNHQSL